MADFDTGAKIAPDLNHVVQTFPISRIPVGLRRPCAFPEIWGIFPPIFRPNPLWTFRPSRPYDINHEYAHAI